jgi:hypothetical integral membrane protein (TIGR02206 family)
MEAFFTVDYQGDPFVIFGPPHLVVLSLITFACLGVYVWRGQFSESQRRWFRYGLAIVLLLNETGWHVWHLATGTWTVQEMLPLHLCSLLVFSSAYMLFTRNYTIYEFSYFMGLGAAIQAILTPDLGIYGYPHFRFFQTFISHGGIFVAAIYMTLVEGYRPYWRSLVRVFIILNLYMIPVTILNLLIGSNYLFTAHKPVTPSLLDVLGPWPWYILSVEVVGVIVCLILYLPWFLRDWRMKAVHPAQA